MRLTDTSELQHDDDLELFHNWQLRTSISTRTVDYDLTKQEEK